MSETLDDIRADLRSIRLTLEETNAEVRKALARWEAIWGGAQGDTNEDA